MRSLALLVLAGLFVSSTGEEARSLAARAAARPATVAVAIEGMKFAPATVTVKPGDTVVWTNKDIVAHTVTEKAGTFDSKIIPPGGTFKYVARKKGSFAYLCSLHQPMTGGVNVQ